jgi:hypothetical protein
MRHFFALATALLLVVSGSAFADRARVVTESDTGIVWGDLACEITSHLAEAPRLYEGDWGYLYAEVWIRYRCMTDDRREWEYRGADRVWFPTVTWNRATQSWEQNGVTIATRRDFRTIELNPALEYTVWASEEDTHVAFKVQVKTARQ